MAEHIGSCMKSIQRILLATSGKRAIHLNWNKIMKHGSTPVVLNVICTTPQIFIQKEPAEQNINRRL